MRGQMRFWRRAIALFLLAALSGLVSAQPVTVRDDRGVEIALASSPQRIVSLLPR